MNSEMTAAATIYLLVEGRGLLIEHFGEALRLEPGRRIARPSRVVPSGDEAEPALVVARR